MDRHVAVTAGRRLGAGIDHHARAGDLGTARADAHGIERERAHPGHRASERRHLHEDARQRLRCRVGRVGVRQGRQHARAANRVPRKAQIQRRQQHDDVGAAAGALRAEGDHRPEYRVGANPDRDILAAGEHALLRHDDGQASMRVAGSADHRGPGTGQHPAVAQAFAHDRHRPMGHGFAGVGAQRHREAQAPRHRQRFGEGVGGLRRRDRQSEYREQRVRLHLGQGAAIRRMPRRLRMRSTAARSSGCGSGCDGGTSSSHS